MPRLPFGRYGTVLGVVDRREMGGVLDVEDCNEEAPKPFGLANIRRGVGGLLD